MNVIRIENFTRLSNSTHFYFLEAMEDLVRVRDNNGEILFENKAMRKIIEKSIISGNEYLDKAKMFYDLYRPSKQKKRSMKREVKIDDKIYSIQASPIFDNNDEILGYIEVYRDVTGERNITNALFKANKYMQDQILLAKTIQKSILPKREKYGNLNFQYGHEPSDDLSGDLFDVIEINKNKIGFYIADVVGHGISASIMTMFIRESMRSILLDSPESSATEILQELKRRFSSLELDISQYFTIQFMLIDLKSNIMTYVNAGHNCEPILFNKKEIKIFKNSGKFISNLFEDEIYEEKVIQLKQGDGLVLYTDGLTETKNKKGEFFDEKKLIDWINTNKNNNKFVKDLLLEVSKFRYREQEDDVAILFMKVGGINEN